MKNGNILLLSSVMVLGSHVCANPLSDLVATGKEKITGKNLAMVAVTGYVAYKLGVHKDAQNLLSRVSGGLVPAIPTVDQRLAAVEYAVADAALAADDEELVKRIERVFAQTVSGIALRNQLAALETAKANLETGLSFAGGFAGSLADRIAAGEKIMNDLQVQLRVINGEVTGDTLQQQQQVGTHHLATAAGSDEGEPSGCGGGDGEQE